MRSRSALLCFAAFFASALGTTTSARADDHPPVRLVVAAAPIAVGIFNIETDGHGDGAPTAFAGRAGVMYAPIRQLQIGLDATVLAPYSGQLVHYATQIAVRGALPLGDALELGLTARMGPGWAHVKAGIAQSKATTPYSPGPGVTYFGWQGGLALDATIWLSKRVALVLAVETIVGRKQSTAGDDVYLGYLSTNSGPFAIAPWIGVQIGS